MRKILHFLKVAAVGFVWSYVYSIVVIFAFIRIWNFDILSPTDWQTISYFWEKGGVIRHSNDYVFLLALLFVIPLWMVGWAKLSQINYVKPLIIIGNKFVKESKKIFVLKNIGLRGISKEELQFQELDKQETEPVLSSGNIREKIQAKISKTKS